MNIEYTLKIIKENQEQLKNTCNQILELLQHKNYCLKKKCHNNVSNLQGIYEQK